MRSSNRDAQLAWLLPPYSIHTELPALDLADVEFGLAAMQLNLERHQENSPVIAVWISRPAIKIRARVVFLFKSMKGQP